MKRMVIALGFAALFAATAQAEISYAWSNRMEIAFSGYAGSTTLKDFPALIKIDAATAGRMRPNGADLRFVDEHGDLLPYEIDAWNPATNSFVWVRVPSLTNTTLITALFGNPDATAPANASQTWEPNYLLVQHFNDPSIARVADSTAAKRGADVKNVIKPRDPDGMIGNAIDLTGNGDKVGIQLDAALNLGLDYSLSVWFKGLQATGHRTLFRGNDAGHHIIMNAPGAQGALSDYEFGIWKAELNNNPPGNVPWQSAKQTLDDYISEWTHIMLVGTGNTSAFYVNGKPHGTVGHQVYNHLSGIGFFQGLVVPPTPPGQRFADYLDEVRVAKTVRSLDWARAEFETVASNATFSAHGNVEDNDALVFSHEAEAVAATTAKTTGILFAGSAAGNTVVTLHWGTSNAVTGVWQESQTVPVDSNGGLEFTLSSLVPNTTYYYRHSAEAGPGTIVWAPVSRSFTTFPAHTQPAVNVNSGATNIKAHAARLQADVTAGYPAPETIFCWGLKDGGNTTNGWDNVASIGIKPLGPVSYDATNLLPDTPYWYACFAVNLDENNQPCWANSLTTFNTLPIQHFYAVRTSKSTEGSHGWEFASSWETGDPRVAGVAAPSNSGHVGHIEAGRHANANINDLGTEGDRPVIIVHPGGFLNTVHASPNAPRIILAGGTLDHDANSRVNNLEVTEDSTILGRAHWDQFHRIESITGAAGITLASIGTTFFNGNNQNCFLTFNITGDTSIYHDRAFGYGPVHFNEKSPGVPSSINYAENSNNNAINIRNPISGCVNVNGRGDNVSLNGRDGVTFYDSVTPGLPNLGQTITASTRHCVLASTASLHINLWGVNNLGQLAVTRFDNGNQPPYQPFTIESGAKLNVRAMPGLKAAPSDVFVIVNNKTTGAVNGKFRDANNELLDEGARLNLGTAAATLTYTHNLNGNSNDIALYDFRFNGTLFLVR